MQDNCLAPSSWFMQDVLLTQLYCINQDLYSLHRVTDFHRCTQQNPNKQSENMDFRSQEHCSRYCPGAAA